MTGGPASDGGSAQAPSWTVAAAVGGLAALGGVALPVAGGWLPPLLLLVLAAGLATRHRARIDGWLVEAGGWAPRHAALSATQQATVLALVVLPAAVVVAVAGRGIGSLLVAFPAAVWGLVVLAVGVAGVTWSTGRARAVAVAVTGALVLLAGVAGERFEAAGPSARGWAHSGPVLGIHPFQTTSIVVDGLGPYDLPINDYVEPDGSRGYGPAELADALTRALAAIAAQHYADGPIRSRRAFADARVEAVTTAPVWESLDHAPTADVQTRLLVTSGTPGQRSRVAFVCPGKQDDPSGIPEENMLKRMCPNKYVSEASAGLGVTGRWTGYAEGRGNERFGLSQWLQWTRSDDETGRRVTAREVRWWAWLAAALGLGLLAIRRRDVAGDLTDASAGVVGVLAVGAVLWLATSAGLPVVGAIEHPPGWTDLGRPRAWLPVAVAFAGVWVGARGPRLTRPQAGWVGALVVVVGTLAAARSVAVDAWVRPEMYEGGGSLALETFVMSAADAFGERAGLTIFEVEGAIAAGLVAILFGAVVAVLRKVGALAAPASRSRRLGVAALVVALCCALVVSRKTDGAAALMPVAMAALGVLSSGLWLSSGPPAVWRTASHVAVVGLALAISLRTLADLPSHLFVTLCTIVAVATLLAGLSFVLRDASAAQTPSEPPG
jgi:hypothetical protein